MKTEWQDEIDIEREEKCYKENKLLNECGKPVTDYLQGFQDGIEKGKQIQKNEFEKKINELKFTGEFKGLDEETDRAYRKGFNRALTELLRQLEDDEEKK